MKTISAQLLKSRRLIALGFLATTPTLFFWIAVCIAHFLHNPKYIDMILADDGTPTRVVFILGLPIVSFILALISRYAIRHQTQGKNLWHSETEDMRINQTLINWNVILISISIIDVIKS